MTPVGSASQPLDLPQPGIATPEENAASSAAAIWVMEERQRKEAADQLERAEKDQAAAKKHKRRLLTGGLGLGMGLVPWLARKLNLR